MNAIETPFSCKGKVIIITGAAGAIGSAAGKLFASQGAYNLTKLYMPYHEKEPNASVEFSGSMVGSC